jgi:DNA-binding LacI/PurR family transcriptional regulator
LLARVPDLSAVFVANDHMALGLSYAFRERGRTVPDEISIVGFDDIPEAEFLTPPLTTIRQDFGALGHAALRELLAQITREPAADGPAPVEPELIVRRSTTRPPG